MVRKMSPLVTAHIRVISKTLDVHKEEPSSLPLTLSVEFIDIGKRRVHPPLVLEYFPHGLTEIIT